jgi:cation transport regulator ChaC
MTELSPSRQEFVFAYGSLVAQRRPVATRGFAATGFVTELRDFRRSWGVAMDNSVDLPGYKYYLDEVGNRPAVYVAFLDVMPTRGASVNGVCLPVDRDQFASLDDRERNYVRIEVTRFVDSPVDHGRVWTYVGSSSARRRLAAARWAGRAVVDDQYLQGVIDAFKRLGPAEYKACASSLDPEDIPVLPLTRHQL